MYRYIYYKSERSKTQILILVVFNLLQMGSDEVEWGGSLRPISNTSARTSSQVLERFKPVKDHKARLAGRK